MGEIIEELPHHNGQPLEPSTQDINRLITDAALTDPLGLENSEKTAARLAQYPQQLPQGSATEEGRSRSRTPTGGPSREKKGPHRLETALLTAQKLVPQLKEEASRVLQEAPPAAASSAKGPDDL